MDVEKRENTKELDDLISNAMEIADVITMQKILEQKHLKYDKSITKLDDLKKDVHKNYSDEKIYAVLKEFNSYKVQSLNVVKNLDVNNLNKFKAEQTIKAIGRTASPITQTLMKSALTIAMYQGLYLMPFPLKLGIAGGVFVTKRVPRMYRGAKNGLESLRNGGLKKVPKKVLAAAIAGGIGAEAVVLLNYLAKESIPGKILNALPGIKACLTLAPSISARKLVLLTTGVVKGVDAYRLKNKENKMFEPIIKGFFMAKGMKVEESIQDFSDVKKYVDKLDDQGKYEFDQYLKKCVSMKRMINNKDSKIKRVGKSVLKLVSDSFEMASYLSLVTPPTAGVGRNGNGDGNGQTQPEPARATAGEGATSKVHQGQTVTAGERVGANQVQPDVVRDGASSRTHYVESSRANSYQQYSPEVVGKNNDSIVPGNAFQITPETTSDEAMQRMNDAIKGYTKRSASKSTEITNIVPKKEVQVPKPVVTPKETVEVPKVETTPEELVDISKKFVKVSPSKWDSFLNYCAEHKDEITAGTLIGGIGAAFMYFMENSGWVLAF